MQKIIDFFLKTAEDLKSFDDKVQTKVQEYSNKQARKVATVGAVAGLIVGVAVCKLL